MSFRKTVDDLVRLHTRKNKDYGRDEDPYANFRKCENAGIPAWIGATIRMGDKISRIETFIKKGGLVNESVEDSLQDLAVYSIIALQLYRERKA